MVETYPSPLRPHLDSGRGRNILLVGGLALLRCRLLRRVGILTSDSRSSRIPGRKVST